MKDIPQHVAIILDGNGRWAKKRGMPRTYGHAAGAKNVEPVVRAASDAGIRYLTLYAFSTENWKRPEGEVKTLMKLLKQYLKTCLTLALENDMVVTFIGDESGLDKGLQEEMDDVRAQTKDNGGMTLIIALNYGGRDEIVRAVRKIGAEAVITESAFSQFLDTAGIPDPDLMIRTSGEERTSNFLPWQLCYSEFYFTEVAWPDFDEAELRKAIEAYRNRDRRFGGV